MILEICSACTAERFFRIDRAQEQLHYVTDVAVEAIYVLDEKPTLGSKESNRNNTVSGPAKSQQRWDVVYISLTRPELLQVKFR